MKQCIQAAPVIEEQKIQGTQYWAAFVKFHQQPPKIVQNSLGRAGRAGREQDQAGPFRLLQGCDQRMRRAGSEALDSQIPVWSNVDLKGWVDHFEQARPFG